MAVAVARRRVAIGGGGADRSGGRGRWCGTFGYVREKVAWRPSVGNKSSYFLKYFFFFYETNYSLILRIISHLIYLFKK